ncbi:MAG: ABC transporter ATP-binding protein [Lachnospiraceae bacterium]|nr:ABC transporter ATP-binding protein [Candidatus Equihabitans merdae]
MAVPAIDIQNVSKYFAKVIANKDVSLTVEEGEVVALLGENGAGKSTIMKILYGLYGKDEGKIFVRGEEVNIKNPADAMSRGIAMIQQHFSLVPTHTATENIILGNVHGHVNIKEHEKKLKEIALKYGFDVPVDVPVGQLAVGQQQKIEILKALYINTSILIMDEPTAVLTPQESDNLMQFIKDFTAKGNSIVFITHKMKEVMEVADKIVVMRNGVVVDTVKREDTDEQELAKLMIGEPIIPPARDESIDYMNNDVVLSIKDVSFGEKNAVDLLKDLNFDIHKGEIFGIAGVSGNGQDELCDVISGLKHATKGTIVLDGEDITKASIKKRNTMGIGYCPVDRYRDAMVMDMTLAENIFLKHWWDKEWSNKGFIRIKKLNEYTNELIKRHRVKANDYSDIARGLSGGNQQKVVLGREVDLGKKLLIFNQPTRGLDMGAVDRIHHVISEEKANGKAVLLISTELSEIFEMCDRIAVMHGGKMMGIYKNGDLTTEQIGLLMAGVHLEDEKEVAE